jgi:hypothetical protein
MTLLLACLLGSDISVGGFTLATTKKDKRDNA